jgi:hypothetical protein
MRISRKHDAKDRLLSLNAFQRRLEAMNNLISDLKAEINVMDAQIDTEIERQQNVIIEEDAKKEAAQ